jgi:hypothetical protein
MSRQSRAEPVGAGRPGQDSHPWRGRMTLTGHDERHAHTPTQQTQPPRNSFRRPDRAPNTPPSRLLRPLPRSELRPSPDPDASLGTSRPQRRNSQVIPEGAGPVKRCL